MKGKVTEAKLYDRAVTVGLIGQDEMQKQKKFKSNDQKFNMNGNPEDTLNSEIKEKKPREN